MAVTISGTLKDGMQNVLPNTELELRAKKTSANVIVESVAHYYTSLQGTYNFPLEVGAYALYINFGSMGPQYVGDITVLVDSLNGTLENFLTIPGEDEITPEILQQVLQARKDAQDAATSAEADAERAEAAADRAEAVSDNEFTFVKNPPTDPDGTIAGIAGTTSGQYFRVAQGLEADNSFIYYLNSGGTAIPVAQTIGYQAFVNQKNVVTAMDTRTGGMRSQSYSKYPFEIVDAVIKLLYAIDDTGKNLMPGGLSTKDISARNITPYSLISSVVGEYALVEQDEAGNALWGTLMDGTKRYLGQPLHNRPGLPYGDFYAIGDSITANGVTFFDAATRKYESFNDLSWHVWGMLLTMGRMRFVGASATGGYTSAQILAQHLPNALKSGASFCVVMAGRNDVVQGMDPATITIPNMTKIFRALRKKGIMPVVCTMSAHGNSVNDSNRTREHTINAWLRGYARKYKLPLVDLHKYTVNPLTGDWLPGYNQDVSHPTNVGAYHMGIALRDGLEEWTANVYPAMADEQLPNNTLGMNLFANGLFLNNDGINPTDWTISSAGVASVRDPLEGEDVSGKVWEIQNQTATITIPVTPGQLVGFGFKLKTDAVGNFSFTGAGASGSGLTNLAGLRNWKSVIPDWGYFYYEFVVPQGQNSITFTLVAGAGKVNLGQLGLLKITEV